MGIFCAQERARLIRQFSFEYRRLSRYLRYVKKILEISIVCLLNKSMQALISNQIPSFRMETSEWRK